MNFGKIFCLVAVFMVAVASFAFADLSVSNTTTLPSVVRPGTQGVVSMTITNSDTTAITSVNAEASGTGGIHSESSKFLGDYKSGTSGSVTLSFNVPSTAAAGIYSLAIKLSWVNATGTFYKSVYVPITVTNPAIFSAEALNKTILTTGDFDMKIRVKNTGGDAKNARVSINSTQFLQTGPTPLIIGDISKGDSEEFVLGITLVQDVTSGAYSLPLAITYNDESGGELTTELKPRIIVKRTSANIDLSPSGQDHFVPGYELPMHLLVENNGDEDAYDVRVGVASASDLSSLESGSYDNVLTSLGGTFANLGFLAAGQSKLIKLNVGVNDLETGFYRQYFVVKSKDSNGDSRVDELTPVGINVAGLTDVNVFVSAKPAPIVAGSQTTLSVLVSNIGTSPIKALIVGIDSDAFELQEAQNQQFIGGLVEDDFSTVQYKVKVADVPDGEYPLNVTMHFKDSYNKDMNVSQIVDLKIVKSSEEGSDILGTLFMVLVIVAIAGGVWYFKFRKKPQTPKKN